MTGKAIEVFVGTAPNHEDAESQAVLEWSIRKHTKRPVSITWMRMSQDPASPFYGWDTARWPTPFSGFRYAVPWLASGDRAIYCDSDVIFTRDIGELFDTPIPDLLVSKTPRRTCVSLWSTEVGRRIMPTLDMLRKNHTLGIHVSARHSSEFPGPVDWNSLDEVTENTGALHYTSMPHQPHLRYAIPRLKAQGRRHWFDGTPAEHWNPKVLQVFDTYFAEALGNGFWVTNYLDEDKFPRFGEYSKASLKGLTGAVPHWGRSTAWTPPVTDD